MRWGILCKVLIPFAEHNNLEVLEKITWVVQIGQLKMLLLAPARQNVPNNVITALIVHITCGLLTMDVGYKAAASKQLLDTGLHGLSFVRKVSKGHKKNIV